MLNKIDLNALLKQAKESTKVLEVLQREGSALARSLLKLPPAELSRKLANEKILASLKKVGLATRSEVRDLERRVEELASELRVQIQKASSARSTTQKSSSGKQPEQDA